MIVQVLFATLAIAGKLALRELPPAALVLLRVGGAAVVLALVLRASGLPGIRGRRDYLGLALYSLLGVVLNQLCYMKGLSLTTAINANILITTIPAFTLGLALIAGSERATVAKVLGLLLALGGAVALLEPAKLDLVPRHALGNALILANAFFYSVYLVVSKPMLRRYPPLTIITWVFLFGALGCLPFGLPALAATELGAVRTSTWLVVAYIVLVPSVATYWLSLWALQRTESSRVAMYVYVQPVVTVLVAPAVLGERLGLGTALAGAAICAGIALATLSRKARPAEDAIVETGI